MAGFAVPYMVSPLHADKEYINPGEAVLLTWRARNATSLQISDDLGNTYNVPPNKGGLFVFPNLYRTYIYTLTATNPAGSISESTKVTVDSFDHSDRSEGGGIVRPELTSLWFSETTIKQGDSVWLFWNTRSANFVSLWDSLTGTNWEKEGKEARYRERVYGERQLTPPASVSFYVIFENQYMSLWQGGLGISVLPK
jgi:hypothetical protein